MKKSVVIHQLSDDESEQKAYYRLLHNENFKNEDVKSFLYDDCVRQVSPDGHYLVIQDTTQPNFEKNRSNITNKEGLGVIGNNKSLGFFLHPSLIIDATDKRSLGFIDIQHWSREASVWTKSEKKKINSKTAIEDKESYRWLKSVEMAKLRLPIGCKTTHISDREGDISESFDRLPDENTHLLIRSKDNRCLKDGGKLYEHFDSLSVCGSYDLEITGDKRIKRVGRTAKINIKYSQVILKPYILKGKEITVYAVEAKEDASTVPAGEKPIHWRLLTTHEVKTLAHACEMIQYYKERWLIEQIFRLLKNKGLQIEKSQMETGKALICLTIMALYVVNKVMLLHNASRQTTPIAIKQTFSESEVACLVHCNKKYEGKTIKQQNPNTKGTLQWVYWVLARMGGWKPHENKAGVISIFRGLQYFYQVFEGWQMANSVS